MLCFKPSSRALFGSFAALLLVALSASGQAGTGVYSDTGSRFDAWTSTSYDFTLQSTAGIALNQPSQGVSTRPDAPTVLFTWSGGGAPSVNWSTGANWGGAAPTSSATTDLLFAGTTNTGTAGTPLNQNIATPMLFHSITFDTTAGNFFLGGGQLAIQDNTTSTITQSSSNNQSIANAITHSGSNNPITLALGGNGTGIVTLSGILSQGSGSSRVLSVTKTGTSTFILSGNNTYGGTTTVSGGKLLVNNTSGSGTGTGAVTVSNSGTVLGGTGTIGGSVTVNGSAKLQGGNGTTGTTLTLAGTVTLNDNSVIQLALGPSFSHSTLARSGSNTWTFDSNQAFTFIDLGATSGTYQNIITGIANPPSEESWTITNAGWTGTFTYDGANIDLSLTIAAVPEPSTWIGGALALFAVGYMQRKRLLSNAKKLRS